MEQSKFNACKSGLGRRKKKEEVSFSAGKGRLESLRSDANGGGPKFELKWLLILVDLLQLQGLEVFLDRPSLTDRALLDPSNSRVKI